MLKRLNKLTHAVRQHSWIEMKKARGFDTPGEFEISPNTKIPAPQSIHKMRAPAAVREVLALQQNAGNPPVGDYSRAAGISASLATGCPGEGLTSEAAAERVGERGGYGSKL